MFRVYTYRCGTYIRAHTVTPLINKKSTKNATNVLAKNATNVLAKNATNDS